jgi:hypothetical protein
MRKLCIVLGLALVVAVAGFAAPDVAVADAKQPNEHEATLIDFSDVAGASYDEATKAKMKTSLAIENWFVQLASSARTVANQAKSMTKMATLKPTAKPFDGEEMSGKIVMGVRVHFPLPRYNSYAVVQPPFEIPAYSVKTELRGGRLVEVQGDTGTKFDGYGVVKNVGVLKSLSATVYGSNYPNGFGVILKDQDEREYTIYLDHLQFDGWRKLTWNNPNYVSEVRNRELRKFPLYPKSMPFMKLVGLIFYRDSMQEGGDLITYVKDIDITYDLAVLETQRDIDDEPLWGILTERQEARKRAELRRIGDLQVLRAIEKEKMDKSQP